MPTSAPGPGPGPSALDDVLQEIAASDEADDDSSRFDARVESEYRGPLRDWRPQCAAARRRLETTLNSLVFEAPAAADLTDAAPPVAGALEAFGDAGRAHDQIPAVAALAGLSPFCWFRLCRLEPIIRHERSRGWDELPLGWAARLARVGVPEVRAALGGTQDRDDWAVDLLRDAIAGRTGFREKVAKLLVSPKGRAAFGAVLTLAELLDPAHEGGYPDNLPYTLAPAGCGPRMWWGRMDPIRVSRLQWLARGGATWPPHKMAEAFPGIVPGEMLGPIPLWTGDDTPSSNGNYPTTKLEPTVQPNEVVGDRLVPVLVAVAEEAPSPATVASRASTGQSAAGLGEADEKETPRPAAAQPVAIKKIGRPRTGGKKLDVYRYINGSKQPEEGTKGQLARMRGDAELRRLANAAGLTLNEALFVAAYGQAGRDRKRGEAA